jgi:speckle-type POZ protein
MAQHLLVAADLYQLTRLRRICERRLCETVDLETAATTLTLAEQNHAEELKRVCLDFVARNLAQVMTTDGYRHMTRSCPALQAELLQVIATNSGQVERHLHAAHRSGHVRQRQIEHGDTGDEGRRVRARREA